MYRSLSLRKKQTPLRIKVIELEKLDRECGAVPVEGGDGNDVTPGDAGVGQAAGEGADAFH